MLRIIPAARAGQTRFSLRALLCVGIMLLASVAVWAQSTSSGTISGQVSDDQGASIPGASVKLIDESTKTPRTVATNNDGRYDVFNLNPGLYEVMVTKPGFAETRFPSQTVQVGLVLTLNATLHVGSTSTTVEVAAAAGAELQTTNATVGSTISGVQLNNLPNLGQDANSLFTLQPGVSPNGNVAGSVSD